MPDGKCQLHATVTAIYQQHDPDIPNIPSVKIERELKPGNAKESIYTIKFCPKPKRETKTYCALLVLQGSPMDWSYLYTALKSAQKVKATVSSAEKTIVSINLQLYSKCVQLQSNLEIKEPFIFRMGELHIVFTALKTLGKIIDGSGLDQSFIEARIYGPNTIQQIKNGKHMKRSFEGFLTLYVSPYKIYLSELIDQNFLIEKELREGVITATIGLNNFRNAEKVELIKTHESLVIILQSLNFQEIQNNFDA